MKREKLHLTVLLTEEPVVWNGRGIAFGEGALVRQPPKRWKWAIRSEGRYVDLAGRMARMVFRSHAKNRSRA